MEKNPGRKKRMLGRFAAFGGKRGGPRRPDGQASECGRSSDCDRYKNGFSSERLAVQPCSGEPRRRDAPSLDAREALDQTRWSVAHGSRARCVLPKSTTMQVCPASL